jgi:hypothetical protein
MSRPGIRIGQGINLGAGVGVGPVGGGGPSGSMGVVGFGEMTQSGDHTMWLEDQSATMISNGFILNATTGTTGQLNGVAIVYLTADNQTFFSTYGTGNKTVTWAAGSTNTSPMTVNLNQNNQSGQPGVIVFFMNNVTTFPATFKFPVTFS